MRSNDPPARLAAPVLAAALALALAAPAAAEAQPVTEELRAQVRQYEESPEQPDPGSVAYIEQRAPVGATGFDYYVLDGNPFVRGGVYYIPDEGNRTYVDLADFVWLRFHETPAQRADGWYAVTLYGNSTLEWNPAEDDLLWNGEEYRTSFDVYRAVNAAGEPAVYITMVDAVNFCGVQNVCWAEDQQVWQGEMLTGAYDVWPGNAGYGDEAAWGLTDDWGITSEQYAWFQGATALLVGSNVTAALGSTDAAFVDCYMQEKFSGSTGFNAGPYWAQHSRDMLRESWGVTDADGLKEQMDWLIEEGHRGTMRSMLDGGAQPEGLTEEWFGQMQEKWPDRFYAESFRAWDMVRCIFLAQSGYAAGYIKNDDRMEYMVLAATVLQGAYTGWQDMAEGYLMAYDLFIAGKGPAYQAVADQRAALAEQLYGDGSYCGVSWSAKLPSPLGTLLGESSTVSGYDTPGSSELPQEEPDAGKTYGGSGSSGGLLVLIWALTWAAGFAVYVYAMRTTALFCPKAVPPAKPPRPGADPGYAAMSVFYGPQRLGQPAPQAKRPDPIRAEPPKVGAGFMAYLALGVGAVSVAVPLFLVPSWSAILLGALQIGAKQNIATRRIGLAALLMGVVSLLGNLLLFAMV